MAATFMDANMTTISDALGSVTQSYPWTFTIAIFVMES
jgi:anaerobic C4-dicarboxylate transporter